MHHLIIFAHPNSETSFNRAILEATLQASQQLDVHTVVRDLYTLNFNPILSWEEMQAVYQEIIPAEVKFEHQLIEQANLITLVYPLWWMGFPAILKGYLDRVLSYGFAYKTENEQSVGLLGGKKMQHFITIGNNVEIYQNMGFAQSLKDCLVDGLFNYCGITDIQHELFGDIHLIDDHARHAMLQRVSEKTQENLTALLERKHDN
ncbi:TPA: NAD(P)H-dependent oxidoreductase [Pasteurella multocida]|uniref:NAD(P)H-dependent oxidoreductase n=1 Tax=Pasteurella multocida TaxID=747 RepID=UPI002021D714|nr:NAD(P)H-dependent oxidoreductase [Pasteurella multocida]MCL7798203.1 NAD(P)H-dependent oxidoreductase [Pasteurella multocida]MCL7802420.1 NAD(P)H-dependent oxidoreductase [Pasteurella multocida]MDG2541209.1 NAD(P)H-dependent oxidoreductase [Pasteurella multocida]URH97126.1 NAD(P)H-dependent oxidoreductase [Pasteurella multocida]HDR0673230.1 NAD(P)H-dependent oxidoreductase [Pasteurella multocida]